MTSRAFSRRRVLTGAAAFSTAAILPRASLGAEWRPTENNRNAKFYKLTPSGRKQLEQHRRRWDRVTLAITVASVAIEFVLGLALALAMHRTLIGKGLVRTGSGDVCDPNETCTGVAGQPCPTNVVNGSSTVCRVGSGDSCDQDERCPGVPGATCPSNDAPINAGVVCRTGSGDACDENERCTGTPGATCPIPAVLM